MYYNVAESTRFHDFSYNNERNEKKQHTIYTHNDESLSTHKIIYKLTTIITLAWGGHAGRGDLFCASHDRHVHNSSTSCCKVSSSSHALK